MANNIDVKDAAAVTRTVKTTDTLGVHTPHQNVDSLPALPIGANHIGSVDVDNTVTVTGTVAATLSEPISVDDNGGSLTVDGSVTAVAQPGVDIGDVTVNNAGGAGAVPIQDGGNSITVDGSITVGAALPAGTNNIGDVDVVSGPTGASAIQVQGTVAHDSPVGQNPVQIGLNARTTAPTAVGDGDVVRAQGDTLGKAVVLVGAVHDRHVRGTGTFTNTTAADIIAAAGAGVRIVVTSVLVTNAHATVGTKVEVRDGTTVKIQGFAAAAGGGFALCDPHGLFITTANTAATARAVTTGADVDVTLSGYTINN